MNSRGWLVRAAVVACAAAPACGQMSNVTPYYVLVSGDSAVLKCGSSDTVSLLNSMYPVAKLQRGQLLKVDAEGAGWSRVAYPVGTYAFVTSDSAQVDPTAKTVTLTKDSRLKASNLTLGLKGSWKDALEQPLKTGAKLNLAEAEAAVDGKGNTAFKVVPPESARAYIQSTAVRKATPEEVAAAQASPTTAPPKTTEAAAASTSPGASPGSLTQPMTPTSPASAPTPPAAPATIAQAPASEPAPAPVATAPTVEPKPIEVKPSPYEKLEAAFDAVRKQPEDSAEYSELKSEFSSALAKLDTSDSSNRILRGRLQQRIDYLQLHSDIQAKKREFAASSEEVAQDEKKLAERLAEVDRARQYTIVGRLTASTIYDGKRLPLMFRVQAVGGPAPRTLAYLKPGDETIKIDSKLGAIVGVIGEAKLDPTLKLNIITPARIDALEAAPATDAPERNPAPAGGAGSEPKAEPKSESTNESKPPARLRAK